MKIRSELMLRYILVNDFHIHVLEEDWSKNTDVDEAWLRLRKLSEDNANFVDTIYVTVSVSNLWMMWNQKHAD